LVIFALYSRIRKIIRTLQYGKSDWQNTKYDDILREETSRLVSLLVKVKNTDAIKFQNTVNNQFELNKPMRTSIPKYDDNVSYTTINKAQAASFDKNCLTYVREIVITKRAKEDK
jgi:hypothetical protein